MRAGLLMGKFRESLRVTPPLTMMSRFKSDARVSVATEDQQQWVIKKRKQDDITTNITVTGLYSRSDHT